VLNVGVDPDKLRQTIARVVGGSVAAQLRQIMPDIELKLAQGVRHEEIVQALQDEGVPVTLESFRKILYRYRAKVRRQNEEIPPAKGNLLSGSSGENSAFPPIP
jgi:signal transduction histidine kinase